MKQTNQSIDLKKSIISLFRQYAGLIEQHSGDILNRYREQAFHDFDRLGVPTTKSEAYRYTSLDRYLKGNYDLELSPNPFKLNLEDIFRCDVPELESHVVLTLNSYFYKFSQSADLPQGVVVCGLNEATTKYAGIFKFHYSQYADTSIDGIVALNTLFAQDGVFIYIPSGVVLDKPLQVINLSHSLRDLRITRRNLVIAGDGSSAGIVVCDHTLCNRHYLINSLTEIVVGKDARLDYSKLQSENNHTTQINNIFVHQHENSRLNSNMINLHGGLIRNNFYVTLGGPSCESNLYGLFLCDASQHVANYTLVDHKNPGCKSYQLFKGILKDESTGVFNGKILVRKEAQKTQAYQRSNNILLSASARMNTKPHLEIYADDVKCSHGATVGQLDKEAMFYLRSRGISESEARHLLMYAFANEIVGNISVDVLKQRIIDLLDRRLRGELSRCNGCNIHCG